uniref:Uncharacterized protein n=1 Tax=Podoviridae sp. ctIlO27 TaxID=2825238 RepID=A0A8S5PZD3_9CAUD|nr:MAG TPA: hypothetical protein [Podoviridae sp. ctIlO27]
MSSKKTPPFQCVKNKEKRRSVMPMIQESIRVRQGL